MQVTGNVIYSAQDILGVAPVQPGDNLFLINKRAIEEEILKNYSFVDTVDINRRFPDTLEINIRESQLLAYVEYEGAYYVINRRCEILSKSDAMGVSGYIRISGVDPLAPRIGEQLALGEAEDGKEDYLAELMELILENELYSQVQWIDASNVSALKFNYGSSMTVNMGGNEELERKFNMLESMIADRADNDRGTIDLSKVGEGHFIPEQ